MLPTIKRPRVATREIVNLGEMAFHEWLPLISLGVNFLTSILRCLCDTRGYLGGDP